MCLRTTLVQGAQLQPPKPIYAQFTYKPTKVTVSIVQHEGKRAGEGGRTQEPQLAISGVSKGQMLICHLHL